MSYWSALCVFIDQTLPVGVAWAQANDDLLPDTVGLNGQVGEYLDGKWYGGLYGWAWPHGFYNLQFAALSAAQCALLLTNDPTYLDLPANSKRASWRSLDELQGQMSLAAHWFDYHPLPPMYPTTLWAMSLAEQDWASLELIRTQSNYDWRTVYPFHNKEDAGHEPPWLEFLNGRNSTYPEEILRASLGQVYWRLDRIRGDNADLTAVYIHHWQERNPVTTEALIQLTLGAPQMIYTGGLLAAPLRYFDAIRQRPGLPPDVAALVTAVSEAALALTLVNLHPLAARTVLLQAGSFGEHES